jgi:hypothetical protein
MWTMEFPQMRELVFFNWSLESFFQIGELISAHQEYLILASRGKPKNVTLTVMTPISGGSSTVYIKTLSDDPDVLSDAFDYYPDKIKHTLQALVILPMPFEDEKLSRTTEHLNKLLNKLHDYYPSSR